jgi:hypothetical protein
VFKDMLQDKKIDEPHDLEWAWHSMGERK